MSEPTDLKAYKGSKKELCMYCGGDEHATQLACPRISAISICPEFGVITDIIFQDGFLPSREPPKDAA